MHFIYVLSVECQKNNALFINEYNENWEYDVTIYVGKLLNYRFSSATLFSQKYVLGANQKSIKPYI